MVTDKFSWLRIPFVYTGSLLRPFSDETYQHYITTFKNAAIAIAFYPYGPEVLPTEISAIITSFASVDISPPLREMQTILI